MVDVLLACGVSRGCGGWMAQGARRKAHGLTSAIGSNDIDTQGRCFLYLRVSLCYLSSLHYSLGENPIQIPCTSDGGTSGATSFSLEVSF